MADPNKDANEESEETEDPYDPTVRYLNGTTLFQIV